MEYPQHHRQLFRQKVVPESVHLEESLQPGADLAWHSGETAGLQIAEDKRVDLVLEAALENLLPLQRSGKERIDLLILGGR